MTHVHTPSHGFADVDQAPSDANSFVQYLDRVRNLPTIGQIDRTLAEIVARLDARRVVEIGCGTGDLLVELTNGCVPPAQGLGVEKSARLTEEATDRHRKANNLRFVVHDFNETPGGDALVNIGYPPGSTDVIVLNRVVQHLPTPEVLLRNAVPLLRDGGAVIISDVDWHTLRLNHPDRRTTELVINEHANSIINPSAGTISQAILGTLGLRDIRSELELVHRIQGFAMADRIFALSRALARLVERGELTGVAANEWMSVAGNQHGFLAELNQTIVMARK